MQKTRTSRSSVDMQKRSPLISFEQIFYSSWSDCFRRSMKLWVSIKCLGPNNPALRQHYYLLKVCISMQKTRTSRSSVDHAEKVRRPGLQWETFSINTFEQYTDASWSDCFRWSMKLWVAIKRLGPNNPQSRTKLLDKVFPIMPTFLRNKTISKTRRLCGKKTPSPNSMLLPTNAQGSGFLLNTQQHCFQGKGEREEPVQLRCLEKCCPGIQFSQQFCPRLQLLDYIIIYCSSSPIEHSNSRSWFLVIYISDWIC